MKLKDMIDALSQEGGADRFVADSAVHNTGAYGRVTGEAYKPPIFEIPGFSTAALPAKTVKPDTAKHSLPILPGERTHIVIPNFLKPSTADADSTFGYNAPGLSPKPAAPQGEDRDENLWQMANRYISGSQGFDIDTGEMPDLAGQEFQLRKAAIAPVTSLKGMANEASYIGQGGARANLADAQAGLSVVDAILGTDNAKKTGDMLKEVQAAGLRTPFHWGEKFDAETEAMYTPSKEERFFSEVLSGATGMIPAIVANIFVPGSSLFVMASGAAGNATQEALESGADDAGALTYGLAVGTIEAMTEKLFDGVSGLFGKGLADDAIESLVKSKLKNETAQQAVIKVLSMLGEGAEEFVAEVTENWVNRVTADTDMRRGKELWGDSVYSFWVGGLVSALMQTANLGGRRPSAEEVAQLAVENAKAESSRPMTMGDFTNVNSPVYNNVDYNDTTTRNDIQSQMHQQMVDRGEVVVVPEETIDKVGESYPDLRTVGKKERTPILKQKISELKENLRGFLSGLRGTGFEFDINGNTIEARLYDTGIREVMEKINQGKASMLYSSEAVFQNARYLYSTQDYSGNPNIYRWNYFYTPVQIGGETVGVRIAIRDMKQTYNTASESQIYNWGIKKDAPLDGGSPGANPLSSDVSSSAPSGAVLDGGERGIVPDRSDVSSTVPLYQSIPQTAENSNTNSRGDGLGAGEVYRLAGAAQERLNSLLSDVAARLGIESEATGQKSLESMLGKVKRKTVSGGIYGLLDMKDHARGKLELSSFDQIPEVLNYLDEKNIPYSTEAIGPTEWGYRGFHITFRDANGIGSEIQLTMPAVWKVKLESDAIYDKWRDVDLSTADAKTQQEYVAEQEKSLQMWAQLDLPDFSMYERSSSSDNTRALYSVSPKTGDFAGTQLPSASSKIPLPSLMPDVSSTRPDSVKQAIENPPFNINDIIPQATENSNGKLPEGTGAKTAEFGYEEAPTQTHSSDGLYTAEEAEKPGIRREDRTHKVNHDVEVDAAARQRYDFDYEGEKADLFNSKQDWDDADTVLAHMILENEVKKARETNSPEAWKAVAKLEGVWRAQGTTQGQALRQRSRFVNTPEAMTAEAAETLYGEMSDVHIRRMPAKRKAAIMKTISDMATRYDAIAEGDTASLINLIKDLNTVRRTTGMFSKETSSQMSWALDYYAKNFEGAEEYLRSVAAQQVRSIAGDYQKTSILEAIKSFRILGMLSKINTFLRNLASNNIFDPLDSLSNNLSVPMDKLLSKYTGTRSVAVDKSWFSKAKRHGSMEGMLKSFIQVGLDAEVDGAQSKYEQRSGRTFKMTGNPIERLLSTWAKFENYALQTTDEMQKGGIKAETQRGLDALTQSGKITNDRKSARRLGEDADTYADERSAEIAKQRTFQNDGILSNAMVKARELGNLAKVTDSQGGSLGVGDMAVTFAKVPGNVAAQGANYSPLGIIKGIGNLVKTVSQAQKGTLTAEQQAKAVTDIGRGLTGTTALAGFVALALKGIISVAGDDDKDEEALKKASGATGTQLNLSALWRWVAGESTEWQDGDTLVSLGFLEPFNALMAAGAMIADSYVEDGSLDLGEILNASVSAVVQAVLELPAMSSIRDLVDGYRYSDKETAGEKVGDALGDFAAGQAGSFVPNFIGGIASGMDNKVRDTYASDSFLGRGLDSVKAKIPGLRQTLPAKLDNFGQERTNTGDWIANMFNSNILPGQINRYKTDEVKDELYRLSEAGAGVSFPARSAPNSINIGLEGEKAKISLNPEEKREYLTESGQKSYEILSELMKTAQYKDFSDEDRVKAISDAYAYARVVAAHKIAQSRGEEYESKEYDPYIKAEENGFDYTHYWQYRNAPDTDGSGQKSKAEYMAAIRAMDSELTPEQRAYIRADLRERWKR